MSDENDDDFAEKQYKDILESLYDGVYFVDRERQINYWNKGAERISGYPSVKVVGHFCQDNLLRHVTESGKSLCLDGCPLLATMQDGKPREAELYLHHADGHRVPVLVHTAPMRDEKGDIIGGVEVFSDNSALLSIRQRMRRLEDTISLDPVTGIGNRRHMERRLSLAFIDYQKNRIPFCVLYVDIDNFKNTNDRYGHEMGDNMLKIVGLTLRDNLRSDDTAARWGGDEFVVLLAGTPPAGMGVTAEKLRLLIEQSSYEKDGGTTKVTVSIGGTSVRREDTPDIILDRADKFMYRSKIAGRNRITLDPEDTDGPEI
jgi:diguanylate cyclase (GGDEF)-like protein/PAS domain S-box-containing protein